MNISPVYKRFYTSIFFGFVIAIATVCLGYFENDDLYQGIWVFLSSTITAIVIFKRRIKENDEERYARLAKSYFQHWIKKDPQIVEGLFASNVPYSVVRWFEKETACNLLACDDSHSVDSWAKLGDEPGELIFRAGLNLGKIIGDDEASKKNIELKISNELKTFTNESLHILGEEIAPGVFFKKLEKGDSHPAGIHISQKKSKCLAMVVQEKRGEKDSDVFNKVSFGLKKEYLEKLSDIEWENVKESIIYDIFPFFKPVLGGSGPQKKDVPLFLTEKNIKGELLDQFPKQAIATYTKIQVFIDKKSAISTGKQVDKKKDNKDE